LDVQFAALIKVLEANSLNVAYYGEVQPEARFRDAVKQRAVEWRIGKIFFALAIAFAVVTIPPIEDRWLSSPITKWDLWTDGNLARLATSALITSAVSVLNVVSRWSELKQVGAIRWLFTEAHFKPTAHVAT
jgi:hypothetical protein